MNQGKNARVGKKLLKFREHLKLDQEAFGVLIGVGQPAVSHYELGHRLPLPITARKIIKLAKKHEYSMSFVDLYS